MSLWIIIGILLLLIEVISTTFFIVFFGLAALSVAAIIAFFTLSIPIQVLLFAFISIVFLLLGKKIYKNRKNKNKIMLDDLIGKIGIINEDTKPNELAKVWVGDTLWTAVSRFDLHKGQKVRILSINNLTVEVEPV